MGVFFGYPDCCITEFENFIKSRGKADRGKRKLSGTGYVPCAVCNKKTVKELKEQIKSTRICPLPFPQDGMDDL